MRKPSGRATGQDDGRGRTLHLTGRRSAPPPPRPAMTAAGGRTAPPRRRYWPASRGRPRCWQENPTINRRSTKLPVGLLISLEDGLDDQHTVLGEVTAHIRPNER